jgi:hypothetical protein
MTTKRTSGWIGHGWLMVFLVALAAADARAAERSALSRWLGDVATPQIRELLARHPRYAGQAVQVSRLEQNGLAGALSTLLTMNLQGREGITLHVPAKQTGRPSGLPARIDDLDCGAPGDRPLRLMVSVTAAGGRSGRVLLFLAEPGEGPSDPGAGTPHRWQWQGDLTRAERGELKRSLAAANPDGSLQAPWRMVDAASAAADLHRQLGCALRPQVKTRLDMRWEDQTDLPPLFADVVNHSRHLLGSYAELGVTATAPDYRMQAVLTPFRENTWQLWLTGIPQSAELDPLQAVAYFHWQGAAAASGEPLRPTGAPAPRPPAPDRGPALDYLHVQLIDALQVEAGSRRAELQVQLRLENRSAWPIEYAFRLSGGHYQHCVPRPGYYRHDRYGRLEGRLDPGQSLVERLVIEGAEHRPNPWLGPRKCAGFRSLEGFEAFDSKGYTVTDYVRWSM